MPQEFNKAYPEYNADVVSSRLRAQFNALASQSEGASEPPDLQRGMLWLDMAETLNWKLKMRIEGDGANPDRWVVLFENVNTLLGSPTAPGGSSQYEHDQAVAANPWAVNHALGRQFVSVEIIDTSASPPKNVDPSAYTVEYDDEDNCTITFVTGATSGKAIVS